MASKARTARTARIARTARVIAPTTISLDWTRSLSNEEARIQRGGDCMVRIVLTSRHYTELELKDDADSFLRYACYRTHKGQGSQ